MRWLIALCAPSLAWAQLRDPIPPDDIPDGPSVDLAGSALAETAPRREDQLAGELSLVASWTRAGVDYTQGFRGPRWTKRWGAALALRAATGSGEQPLDLEERAEVALYAGSIGQSVRWQSQPRLTDRFWNRRTENVELGGFLDFGGLGLVTRSPDGDLSAEGFPMYVEVKRTTDEVPITSFRWDVAVARVAGERGDLRIIDESITIQKSAARSSVAFDAAAMSARSVAIRKDSPWRFSGAFGLSCLVPTSTEISGSANSIIPLVRIGIEHRGSAQMRTARSEIGRPLLDNTDFGVELASLHRMTETTVDAGGQLTAWWQRPLTAQLVAYGEGMLGVAHHQLVIDGEMAKLGDGVIVIARGELGVTAKLGAGFHLDTRAWAEHSDRAAPMLPARWDVALLSGITFRM
jgi:hypothetical protein